ncbi:MAG: hypothetical protein KatS3mg130_0925 [Candidatus Sumerlaea sp.]|nr:MAG: hypothetical protein KatS3mg130_0925 [Candidatus Sumerlaea sp.]
MKMAAKIYIALLHYPMRDRRNNVVCTSVTNLDIHDIARSCRTYGVAKYFVVTPILAQRWLAERILTHWEEGWGATYNPNRKEALESVAIVPDLGEVAEQIKQDSGREPLWIATSARRYPNTLRYGELTRILNEDSPPVCLIFGTGWGIHPELLLDMDHILEPIVGPTEYNHLSVRAAVAIILDRLLAPRR